MAAIPFCRAHSTEPLVSIKRLSKVEVGDVSRGRFRAVWACGCALEFTLRVEWDDVLPEQRPALEELFAPQAH
jgi:hypothetical protein